MNIAKFIAKLVQVAVKYIRWGLNSQKASSPAETVQASPRSTAKPSEDKYAVSDKLIASASNAAKPPRLQSDTFFDTDENGNDVEYEFSFMLSGDFLQFESHAMEVDYSAVYEPYSEEEYGDYDIGKPVFMIVNAAEKDIYDMIDTYKHEGTPQNAYSFERVGNLGSKIYFKATVDYHGEILYFYALDRGSMWENCYIGVSYGKNAAGTALEKKLKACLDETVATYKETIVK